MRVSVPQDSEKPKKRGRVDAFQEVVWEQTGMTEREKKALSEYAYWLVGHSKMSTESFRLMVADFLKYVPQSQWVSQAIKSKDMGYRNLVPDWFRNPQSKFDTANKATKKEVTDIDYTEKF